MSAMAHPKACRYSVFRENNDGLGKWMFRTGIALLAAFLVPTPLEAELSVTSSVEWLTCSSKIVAVGRMPKIASVKGPGEVIYEDCLLTVSESIKGDVGKEVAFSYRHFPEKEEDWKKPGQELLVFLSVWEDGYTDEQARNGLSSDTDMRMHGKLVPTGMHSSFCIMTLSRLTYLFDKDMVRLADRDSVLALCRKWAASPIIHSVHKDVPPDSEVWRKYYAGSAVWLEVPAEDSHRVRFLKIAKSGNPWERADAAAELWKFPGDETEAVLRSLLGDQTESIGLYANDTIYRISFRVRSAAFRSLQQLGKSVEPLPLERKPTAEEQTKYRHDAWRKSFKQALKDGWEMASISDGETRMAQSRECTVVLIQLAKGPEKCDLALIPKELDRDTEPDHEYLGINGRDSQGARRFYSLGKIPDSLRTRLTQYFGLVID